jgi:hypothetical protein
MIFDNRSNRAFSQVYAFSMSFACRSLAVACQVLRQTLPAYAAQAIIRLSRAMLIAAYTNNVRITGLFAILGILFYPDTLNRPNWLFF